MPGYKPVWTWGQQYGVPVGGPRKNKIEWMTIERMRLLFELKDILTGRSKRKHNWEHRKAVWAAYRARAGAWKEE